MEKVGIWDRQIVISELTQGMELAKELKRQLYPNTGSREARGILIEKILSCYDNALAQFYGKDLLGNGDSKQLAVVGQMLEQPSLIDGGPRREVFDKNSKDQVPKYVPKKRKREPRRSEQVQVCSGAGFKVQQDDGHNWRKYGQKDILGANHPRAYYRCTHRYTQGCLATKLVQQTDGDPSLVECIYRGKHSCVQERLKKNEENAGGQASDGPARQHGSQRLSQQSLISADQGLEPQECHPESQNFLSFSSPSTLIESEYENTKFLSEPRNIVATSYSPAFLSPATPGSCFSHGYNFRSSESNFSETVSNPTSETNFPLGDLDFWTDKMDFGSGFPDLAEFL